MCVCRGILSAAGNISNSTLTNGTDIDESIYIKWEKSFVVVMRLHHILATEVGLKISSKCLWRRGWCWRNCSLLFATDEKRHWHYTAINLNILCIKTTLGAQPNEPWLCSKCHQWNTCTQFFVWSNHFIHTVVSSVVLFYFNFMFGNSMKLHWRKMEMFDIYLTCIHVARVKRMKGTDKH